MKKMWGLRWFVSPQELGRCLVPWRFLDKTSYPLFYFAFGRSRFLVGFWTSLPWTSLKDPVPRIGHRILGVILWVGRRRLLSVRTSTLATLDPFCVLWADVSNSEVDLSVKS